VDGILSGSIPYAVATSFHAGTGHRSQAKQKTYTQLLRDLEDEAYTSGEEGGTEEEWMRRGSTWRIQKQKKSDKGSAVHIRDGSSGPRGPEGGDEEAGEETALLSGEEREERRDRIAQIALYGEWTASMKHRLV
jgi:hypothetical protein